MSDPWPDLSSVPTWTLPPGQRLAATPELWLCQALSRSVAFDAAAVVVGNALDVRCQLAGSDPQLRRFGDLQQTVAQGPWVDLLATQQPVLIADLADELHRWPMLAAAGGEQPIGTLGLFPLRLTDESTKLLGALVIARRQVELFADRDLDILHAAAQLIATIVGSRFSEVPTDAPRLTGLLTDDVSTAVGIVGERMGYCADDALARLRATAFADGVTIQQLAHRLVTGEHVELTE